jgi:ADP-ribosyl-[dinitrogen reductase] hydrolase
MKHGDSVSNPLRVDWLNVADLAVPGQLGRTFLPGKNHLGVSGVRHARSADADCERLRTVYGIDVLVLLNEDHEIDRFVNHPPPPHGPQDLFASLSTHHIELLRLPIPDSETPSETQISAVRALLAQIVGALRTGRRVAVACRGGIGRTGTVLALALIELGCSPVNAIQRVRLMKPKCIDPGRQEEYVRTWKRSTDAS